MLINKLHIFNYNLMDLVTYFYYKILTFSSLIVILAIIIKNI